MLRDRLPDLAAISRRVFAPWQPRAVILAYHRVAALEGDPQLLAVSPQHFGAHLEIIATQFRPMALREMHESMRHGTLPHHAVAVTFDDGYADNLHHARPLLEQFGVPATVFATAGQIGSTREFWWDDLERLLLRSSRACRVLELKIQGQHYSWYLDSGAEGKLSLADDVSSDNAPGGDSDQLPASRAAAPQGDRDGEPWNVTSAHTPTGRHVAYRQLHALLKPMEHAERLAVLTQLAHALGQPLEGRPTHRALTRDELRRLADNGLIEIGAHTVTHPQLCALSPAAQMHEIKQSRTMLQAMLEAPVTSFSYPFGSHTDFDCNARALVKSAGFELACANMPGVITTGRSGRAGNTGRASDVYELPRFLVRDWDGEAFERQLYEMFEAPPMRQRMVA